MCAASLQRGLADTAVTRTAFSNVADEAAWLKEMSRRLAKRMPDEAERLEFLTTLHWEASRAGVDPQLMLGLIQVESGFRKYAVSPVGARGYTQVMPFWAKAIGSPDHNLFQLRTNLRYGALILRHYIDIERGDLYPRAGPLQRQPGASGISHPRRRRLEAPLGLHSPHQIGRHVRRIAQLKHSLRAPRCGMEIPASRRPNG